MKNRYIFPDFLAKFMSRVDQRTQLEASMLSMTLMSVGLILSVIYAVVYLDLRLWFKIVLIINGFFGLVFMYSYVTTMFQQYLALMETIELQKHMEQPFGTQGSENFDNLTQSLEMKGGN